MFYVSSDPEPMENPGVINASNFKTIEAARDEALYRAEEQHNGSPWYVHEFPMSTVVYKASAVLTISSEVLNGTPDPS